MINVLMSLFSGGITAEANSSRAKKNIPKTPKHRRPKKTGNGFTGPRDGKHQFVVVVFLLILLISRRQPWSDLGSTAVCRGPVFPHRGRDVKILSRSPAYF